MKTILYHCSNVLIEQFDFSEGVHFGGMLSALEAGLRKSNGGTLYLHKCMLEIADHKIFDVNDLGSKENWDKLIPYVTYLARYTNKYEPDSVSSYFVLDERCVKMLSVKEVCTEEAERICSLMYDFYGD